MDRILCAQAAPDPVRKNMQCKVNAFQFVYVIALFSNFIALLDCNYNTNTYLPFWHYRDLTLGLIFLMNHFCMLKPKIS